jgi:uncharacterized protein
MCTLSLQVTDRSNRRSPTYSKCRMSMSRSSNVWLIGLTVALAIVCVEARPTLGSLQQRVIFPGQVTQGRASALVEAPKGTEILTLTTAHGDRIVALFGAALRSNGEPDPRAAARPTLLYFYGNGDCLKKSLRQFDHLRKLGVNVLIPEYVGYGMSSGRACEAGCYATADAAYDHLLNRTDIDPRKIVSAGWSLGSAVAVDLAARRPVAGLAIFSALTSMVEMSHRFFPYLPAKLLIRYRFDSLTKIARVHCPTLIGHGCKDLLIPSFMSDRLADAAGGPVSRVLVERAGHSDFFVVGAEELDQVIARFLNDIDALNEASAQP